MLMLCGTAHAQRVTIDLTGEWDSSLGKCHLPGTTDENKLGGGEHATNVTTQLTRLFPYSGKVTYEREVEVTKEMAGKKMSLLMERTKPSTLWVDGDCIGSRGHLYAPHVYELPALKAGVHKIKICIDNSSEAVPAGVHGSHAWTDATQTNWNGVIGKFAIVGTDATYICNMQLYPDVEMNEVTAKMKVFSAKGGKYSIALERNTFCGEDEEECRVAENVTLKKGMNEVEIVMDMGENPSLWSEFHPDVYTMTATLNGKDTSDKLVRTFGMRKFTTEGTQFVINGNKTFLRGTHDACVFPLTGYCPADVNEWKKMFAVAKQYGINHYRFHSYTPTEAAFEAADEMGIYLHTELPLWGTIDSTTVAQNEFLRREAFDVLEHFGNHPSFIGLGLGNELWGDVEEMRRWLDEFRAIDNRHLYSMGSNNDLGWKGPKEGEDFYITCRVGGGDGFSTHARTSFSFADADQGGILNWERPNTVKDFSGVVPLCKTPIVSHETCQFQIYPDYKELPKYTGVLYPYNHEIFRDRLKENGLTPQIDAFHEATGKWAVDCYKADMEYCLRTPGFGGYQLLDIKDYPGQGSALVGILDAFMDSKGLVDPEVFKGWNSPIVPMALMDSFCFTTADTLKADVVISNYSEDDYRAPIVWALTSVDANGKADGVCSASGEFDFYDAWQGEVTNVGKISVPLANINKSTQMRLTLESGEYKNYYNVWVYAVNGERLEVRGKGVLVADTLDAKVIKALKNGKTVVMTPKKESIEKQSVGGLFTPDYWNYAMFKTISENNNKPVSPGTLGMLMDPAHPLFSNFPTEGRSDWQWWCIALNSRPLILNCLSKDYLPLIQTVDNVERNHKLGILMEFKVGKSKLLVSTTDFDAISKYPEGKAYADAVMRYAESDSFNPQTDISIESLQALLYSETKTRDIQGVKNITDYKDHD